jgi:hypothetical protein
MEAKRSKDRSADVGVPREFLEAMLKSGDRYACWTDWPYSRRWGDQPSISCIHPITGKRWHGPVRTFAWFLLRGNWPKELKPVCETHGCWNPHHGIVQRTLPERNVLEAVTDDALLAEVQRRGLLPRKTNA